ncbi:MAG: SPFH domain-containing protein [Anaerolineae bacterium]|nr:SPFH domain-containing protein [Anaerolineae bacterium]
MIFLIMAIISLIILTTIAMTLFRRSKTRVVPEDTVAVTVDRDGFVRRILPAGRYVLHPFERIEFNIETRATLAVGRAEAIASRDGVLININWSGVYNVSPHLITEKVSQRLRGLSNASPTMMRNVDICLRQLAGNYTVEEFFKSATRERIERQLGQLVAERLRGLGIVLSSINLQAIELPAEVAEAINKAKALAALDGAIRQLDPTTREVVRGVYQLDEILHWDNYLPRPSRLTMKRLREVSP